MTDFYYNNEERLMQLQKEILGEKGKIEQAITPENLVIYKFLISMSIYYNLSRNVNILNTIREHAILLDSSLKNRVFFEKCEAHTVDTLYFQNFMNEASRDRGFLGVYQTYFDRAA